MKKAESLEDVLQMAKEQTGTFEELARELGIVKTTITKWRNGTRWPTDQQCKQLAEQAGISTETVLMLCMLEKKKESPTLREWKKIALPFLMVVLLFTQVTQACYQNWHYVNYEKQAATDGGNGCVLDNACLTAV